MAGEYYCTEHVGGTKVRWSDGYRQCDPPPDAWHYCALYHGSQVSRDVWVWPKATHQVAQVGAGAKITGKVEPVANPATGHKVLV